VNITAAGVAPAGFSGVFIDVQEVILIGEVRFAGERQVDFEGDFAGILTGDLLGDLAGDLTGDLDGVGGLAKRNVGV